MSKTIYDIFISYRRDGGGATAGRINDMLTADGYSVSYDVDTLREGRFDKQLLERIEQCQDFILVVDKNCFVRTIDSATDPQDDWLWQELSYALQLKKNIIPVLLAGASFPKKLPEDIDNVRLCNGPKCVHEYFDSFYTKLKEMLRAYPRLAKPLYMGPASTTKNMPCLKLKADIDCIFYLDGEERSHLKAGVLQKIPLAKGEYELMFVSEENGNDRLELEFEMPDVDKLQKVNLSNARNARQEKEAEAKRIAEEKRQAEERRRREEAEARRIAEERKREAERKAEEERKRREEKEWTKEKTFNVGGVLFKMIHVEGGSFMMGSPNNNSDAYCEKKSRHRVTLSDYYIGETLVTLALWKAVMGNFPITPKGDNLPVEKVSWIDCRNFINRLNKKLGDQILNGNRFCLPTEAQWEYAARGGNKAHDYIYAGSTNIEDVAWYGKNSSGNTRPVKTKLCNELGLYDMSGNVWEWCQNRQDDYKRVLCGGSWISDANNCLVDSRSYYSPDSRYIGIGFRLALVHQ